VQRIKSPHPKFYIGKGKVDELKSLVEEKEVDLVIFDEELSPAQGMNLEQLLDVRVMDRAELILDIFATRAQTHESRMQVELAQLEYLLPRLKRMWTHLSRIRGGIGLRGPGETQLETDRRLIGVRLADLRRKLRDVAKSRATQRKSRDGRFRVALVGYTNAGKSSVLQALSGSKQFIEDRLFATLDSSTRAVDVGDGFEVLVTDTVGFIRKLPHQLVASFRSTLEEAGEADVLLHVIDASHSDWESQRIVVEEVLEDLGLKDRPQILAMNKTDLLSPDELATLRVRTRELEPTPAVFTSTLFPETLISLKEALKARIRSAYQRVTVKIPAGDGKTLAALYEGGEVVDQRQVEGVIYLVVNAPESLVGRLRALGVHITSAT